MPTPTPSRSGKERKDLRQELAEILISQIEAGTASWQKPWAAGEIKAPINVVTGKPYRGVNREWLLLVSPDPTDPRWCTYKQAEAQGWQVRKGEHGASIEVFKEYDHTLTEKEKSDMRRVREKIPDPVRRQEALSSIPDKEKRLGVKYYSVFHASQIDGIPPLERPEIDHEIEGKPDERLPKLIEAMGVDFHTGGGVAFYKSSEDRVQMPPVEAFLTATGHDTTLLHELSHATGHESRLGRNLGNAFGSSDYAKEELRAEMAAAMTAVSLGIGFDPQAQNMEENANIQQNAAYLASWLKALPEKERKTELMAAIKDAQGISDYLIERTPEIARTAEQDLGLNDRGSMRSVPETLVPFLSESQRLATENGLKGEDRIFFAEKMQELERIIDQMPATYDTDGKPDAEKPVGLRYFGPGGAQWFIIEKDRGDPENDGPGAPRQLQAFGLADLGVGEPELGYISIEEITKNPGVELDYHFEPTNLLEVKKAHYPDMVPDLGTEQPTVSRGDYVRFRAGIGREIEGVVLDDARPGEATRLRVIYRLPNDTLDMDAADHIMPRVLPDDLVEHIPGAVTPGSDLDAIDPRTDAYKLTMGMDGSRERARRAVLMAVETARGQSRDFSAPELNSLDPDLVAHLEDRQKIRQGERIAMPPVADEWPGGLPTGLGGDPIENAEHFVRDTAMRDPERAERWADALLDNPREYAEKGGLDADNIRGIASQMEEGIKRMKHPKI